MNATNHATKFSLLILLKDRSSAGAATAFSEGWVGWVGIRDRLLADQGSEFRKDFSDYCTNYGLPMRVIPTEAPWQAAIVERHGAVLGEIAAALMDQFSLTGAEDMATL